MSGAYIRRRKTSKGQPRYLVCYRISGMRDEPILYAGTFKTMKEARLRRDFVAGEIAVGRDPRVKLAALSVPREPTRTFTQWATLYIGSRSDLSASGIRNSTLHLKDAAEALNDRPPASLTVADCQAYAAELVGRLQPTSVRAYFGTFRLLLDFAKVDPNPARDKTIRLPKGQPAEVSPPSAPEFLALLEKLSETFRLPVVLMEQTAMRVTETMTLQWGDVDVAGCRFRLRADATKTSRARWVQVPEWLMEIVDGLCAQEDRVPGRRVLRGTVSGLRAAMERACRDAGIVAYSPHDLRHRRASLWHGQGVSARDLAERGGWAKADVPLRVYSHVMPLDEAATLDLETLLGGPR